MKNNKKKVISIVSLVLIVVLVITATYAYFQAQIGDGAQTDINITAGTVDSLTFATGDAISIEATQSNFATGMSSLSDDTYATATLVANNSTNYAEATYYVYLNISSNDFVYTTSDETAELILTVTVDGEEVTNLGSLTYTTVTDNTGTSYSGFDITTASGLISLAELYEMVSTGTEVDEWEITVTFVNLSTDQSGNAGASFSASLIIQQEEIATFANYIISLYTEDGENGMYYFDGEGDYTNSDLEAVDYSYRYVGSSDEVNNYVCFGSENCTDIDSIYRIIGVYQDLLGNYQIKLIKADYATSILLGEDGEYVSNSNSIQPDYETYYLGSQSTFSFYRWIYSFSSSSYENSGYYNDWSYSQLNTVNLNTNYLANIGSKWSSLISYHTWIVGGNTYDNIYGVSANIAYNNELVDYVTSQGSPNYVTSTYNSYIGLMYVSDYAYAVSPEFWSNNLSSYNDETLRQNNWLYIGSYEWTITRVSSNTRLSYYIYNTGNVRVYPGSDYNQCYVAVRPTFYLNSSVQYISGSGTIDDPYIIG